MHLSVPLLFIMLATAQPAVPVTTGLRIVSTAPDVFCAPDGKRCRDITSPTLMILANEPVLVDSVLLAVTGANGDEVARTIHTKRLVEDTGELGSLPVPALISAALLHRDGLAGIAGAPVVPATDAEIGAGETLIVTGRAFVFDFNPKSLTATVTGRTRNGERRKATITLPIAARNSAISYRMPLDGSWLASPYFGVASHHRATPPTQFAIDLFAVRDGIILGGDPRDPHSYFGYGAVVRAAADGEVVATIADVPSERARRIDEARRDPDAAFGAYVDALKVDARRAALGNLVVIRHDSDTGPEFSTYAHLMESSVVVRVGDRVSAGQRIGKVGDTGEMIEPHLHFQVNDGPDPLLSRSLPFEFSDAVTGPGPDGDRGRLIAKSAAHTN